MGEGALKVIGVGDNVVDNYVNERIMFPGGNALNFSVFSAMLGCDSAYLGIFGTDVAASHVQKTRLHPPGWINHSRGRSKAEY